jgi:hypothetical protein
MHHRYKKVMVVFQKPLSLRIVGAFVIVQIVPKNGESDFAPKL